MIRSDSISGLSLPVDPIFEKTYVETSMQADTVPLLDKSMQADDDMDNLIKALTSFSRSLSY